MCERSHAGCFAYRQEILLLATAAWNEERESTKKEAPTRDEERDGLNNICYCVIRDDVIIRRKGVLIHTLICPHYFVLDE